MKFCSKCGSQMEDNAAFCPNCGAPAGAASAGAASGQPGDSASRLLAEKKHSRITSAMVLNVLAFLLSLVACAVLFLTGVQHGEDPPDGSYTIEHDLLGEFLGYDTAKIVTPDEKMAEWAAKEAERRESNENLLKGLILWQSISLVAMVMGFAAAKGAKKKKKGTGHSVYDPVGPACGGPWCLLPPGGGAALLRHRADSVCPCHSGADRRRQAAPGGEHP